MTSAKAQLETLVIAELQPEDINLERRSSVPDEDEEEEASVSIVKQIRKIIRLSKEKEMNVVVACAAVTLFVGGFVVFLLILKLCHQVVTNPEVSVQSVLAEYFLEPEEELETLR